MTGRRTTEEHEQANRELGGRVVRGSDGRAANGDGHAEMHASNGTAPALERLRVILADPDPLARRAIRDSLRTEGGFVVSAEAKDGLEAIELAVHYRPDLVLMEIALPGVDGISACREITTRAPTVRVVMFSVPQDREVEVRALRAGASGFLSKNSSIESIARALRSVAERRGCGHAFADLAPRRPAALDRRERHRHAAGQEPAHDARVGGARPDLRRRLHARDLGEAVPLRGHRLQPHQEHPAQARRALAHRRGRDGRAAAPARSSAEPRRAPSGANTLRGAMRVGIVGLGYVGLPLAVAFAQRRRRRPRRRHRSAQGRGDRRRRAPTSRTSPTRRSRRSAAASRRARITRRSPACDAILICVPTPLTANREPDLAPLLGCAAVLGSLVAPGQLVVLESTTYPGTTRERVAPLLEAGGLRAGVDFNLAYSPERVDPGRTDYTLANTPKVVGGLTRGLRRPRRGALPPGLRRGRARRRRPRSPSSRSCSRTSSARSTSRSSTSSRCSPTAWGSTSGRSSTRPRPSRTASCASSPGRGWAATAFRSTPSTSRGARASSTSRPSSSSSPARSTSRCPTTASRSSSGRSTTAAARCADRGSRCSA